MMLYADAAKGAKLAHKLRNVRRRVKATALASLPRKFDSSDSELVMAYVDNVLMQILKGKTNEFVFGFPMEPSTRTVIAQKAAGLGLDTEELTAGALRVFISPDSTLSILYAYKHDLALPNGNTPSVSGGDLILAASNDREADEILQAAEQMGLRGSMEDPLSFGSSSSSSSARSPGERVALEVTNDVLSSNDTDMFRRCAHRITIRKLLPSVLTPGTSPMKTPMDCARVEGAMDIADDSDLHIPPPPSSLPSLNYLPSSTPPSAHYTTTTSTAASHHHETRTCVPETMHAAVAPASVPKLKRNFADSPQAVSQAACQQRVSSSWRRWWSSITARCCS
eukprot:Blabericola_migrator_1__5742@NODE_290_length_10281_cov_162_780693_g238_i0_p4_GENE_NODE_290_length_10281_cov_162_780693_g238_i0NODE_290_length_10281_cov_162_780693_g238_i0_p4_ORF_typecomplete_len338_score44_00_NODE_290_length_10281_cov_162_780693_g238_i039304943